MLRAKVDRLLRLRGTAEEHPSTVEVDSVMANLDVVLDGGDSPAQRDLLAAIKSLATGWR